MSWKSLLLRVTNVPEILQRNSGDSQIGMPNAKFQTLEAGKKNQCIRIKDVGRHLMLLVVLTGLAILGYRVPQRLNQRVILEHPGKGREGMIPRAANLELTNHEATGFCHFQATAETSAPGNDRRRQRLG